jgi:hypothetical protein
MFASALTEWDKDTDLQAQRVLLDEPEGRHCGEKDGSHKLSALVEMALLVRRQWRPNAEPANSGNHRSSR